MDPCDPVRPSVVSELVYRDDAPPWLSVYSDEVHQADAAPYRTRHVELMDGQPGAVCIALHGELVLLAKLWRPAIGAFSLEFPRGMGEPGESTIETAIRELREETGVSAVESSRELGVIYADSGLLSNSIGVVEIATSEAGLRVGPELTDAAWLPLAKFTDAIGSGRISDGITLAAWAIRAACQ